MAARHAPPRAAALVESLRGLGYSLATAIADIIDNSIAAAATTVEITFDWAGDESSISILDNGRGMTAAELDAAMRLGERNPLDTRAADDLGRFGLGLKTASFSQGRSLTVASLASGQSVECLRWDLDFLASTMDGGWYLLEGCRPGSEALLLPLERSNHGTLVVIEKLDRLVSGGSTAQDFLDAMDRVERHLGMTFHRYLEGSTPRLSIRLNTQAVRPWDPFLTDHASKPWAPPAIRLGANGEVEVQCHVLPHKDRLTEREHEAAAGPDGWTSGQGFYIYRNERLLVAGGWLGLGAGRQWNRDEAHRLARIRIDIPNTADADWKLDIRKSTARPPLWLRKRLTRLADETRHRARRVFAHRGRSMPSVRGDPVEMAWEVRRGGAGVRYRISRDHESVRAILEQHPSLHGEIEVMLRCIEETVPVQRIWLDTAEERETPLTGFVGEPDREVLGVLSAMYRTLVGRKGMSPSDACARLSRTEPFDRYPALIASLPDAPEPAGD